MEYAKADMEVNGIKTEVYMHRLIMGLDNSSFLAVDHKDWNGLNNQRDNLRVATRAQNQANIRPLKTAFCEYKGVSYDKNYPTKPWRARIKNTLVGYFHTPEGAAVAYNKKALELYGEFAYLNIIKNERTTEISSYTEG